MLNISYMQLFDLFRLIPILFEVKDTGQNEHVKMNIMLYEGMFSMQLFLPRCTRSHTDSDTFRAAYSVLMNVCTPPALI